MTLSLLEVTKRRLTVIQQLNLEFSLKDLRELTYFLGLEIHRHNDMIRLPQRKYVNYVLLKADMSSSKSVPKPMITSLMLSATDGCPLSPEYALKYRSIVEDFNTSA